METKSRYEVISELERNKRDLIKERDGLNDTLLNHEKELKDIERQKDDTIVVLDRRIEDKQLEIKSFKESITQKKETIQALIDSIDTSLQRFSIQAKAGA